jgi:hypothetical protein
MARFFENYDGQVSIPRRVVMDTSRDEQVAREVQRSLGLVIDTDRDLEVARRLQQQIGGDGIGGNRMNAQLYDEEMTSLRQRRLDLERRRQGYGGVGRMTDGLEICQFTSVLHIPAMLRNSHVNRTTTITAMVSRTHGHTVQVTEDTGMEVITLDTILGIETGASGVEATKPVEHQC